MRKTAILAAIFVTLLGGLFALRAPAGTPAAHVRRALAAQRVLAAEKPGDALVLNDLGNLLVLTGEHAEAEEAYRAAIASAPKSSVPRYNLALLLLELERPRAALTQLHKVLDAEPSHAWAHYQAGIAYSAIGAGRRALKQYAAAFRLDPNLAFPEVNPHVIDNPILTEAMLVAYRDLPLDSSGAPKTYAERERIVDLMLPADEGSAVTGESGKSEDVRAAPAENGSRPAPAFSPDDGAGGTAAETGSQGERVLRPDDLERGSRVNQSAPGVVYQPAPQGGTRAPVRNQVGGGREDSQGRDTGTPGTPAARERFVPGSPSTGRLEIELLPPAQDTEAATRA